jgi:hypothetical protein
VSPGNNIIRRIGNADESSYLEMSGGCDIITPGNKVNIQCAQFNVDVTGSTARITTDDTLTLEGRNMVANIQDTTTINTPNLIVTGISSATASDVLYYDSGTGNVTYGAPASGGTPTVTNQFYGQMNPVTNPSSAVFATPVVLQSLGSLTLPANTFGAGANKGIQCDISGVIDVASTTTFFSDVGFNGSIIGSIGGFSFTAGGSYTFTATIKFVPNTTAYVCTFILQTPSGMAMFTNGGVYFGSTAIPILIQPVFRMTPANPGNGVRDILFRVELLS